LVPGLMYDRFLQSCNDLQQEDAVATFNRRSKKEKREWVVSICESFITGDIYQVPPELQILLVVRPIDPDQPEFDEVYFLITCVPFILQDVLRAVVLTGSSWLVQAKDTLSMYFRRMRDASEGERYEDLFAICYLTRCIFRLPYDDILLGDWLKGKDVEVWVNKFKTLAGRSFEECDRW
jgi:hypothetical protein